MQVIEYPDNHVNLHIQKGAWLRNCHGALYKSRRFCRKFIFSFFSLAGSPRAVKMKLLLLTVAMFGALGAKTFYRIDGDGYGPFKSHFHDWLVARGHTFALEAYDNYGATGTFGGKDSDGQGISKTPVIFIHGNSDSALDTGAMLVDGWTKALGYYIDEGYTFAELYGITYGDRDMATAADTQMTCEWMKGHRKFVEDVLEYTGAPKVNLVGHSMGATIARFVAKGGSSIINGEHCDLGHALTDKIDVLISVAGAHFGMCMCTALSDKHSCSSADGFWPGNTCGGGVETTCATASQGQCTDIDHYSTFLKDINNNEAREAGHVFSLFSRDDNVLGPESLTWGRMTSIIPNEDGNHEYGGYTHFEMKDKTAADAIWAFHNHALPPKDRRKLKRTGIDILETVHSYSSEEEEEK
ncbi:unnamed protein product, partial [Mesorhabditis spiculigera]